MGILSVAVSESGRKWVVKKEQFLASTVNFYQPQVTVALQYKAVVRMRTDFKKKNKQILFYLFIFCFVFFLFILSITLKRNRAVLL